MLTRDEFQLLVLCACEGQGLQDTLLDIVESAAEAHDHISA